MNRTVDEAPTPYVHASGDTARISHVSRGREPDQTLTRGGDEARMGRRVGTEYGKVRGLPSSNAVIAALAFSAASGDPMMEASAVSE